MDEDTKPVENTGDTSGGGLSRRDALKAGGAAAAGAMFFGAMSPGAAGAATSPWHQADYLNFAKLTNAVWKKPSLRTAYAKDPAGVLKQFGITLPPGTPAPVIPAKPAATLGTATSSSKAVKTKVTSSFANWDLQVNSAAGGDKSVLTRLYCLPGVLLLVAVPGLEDGKVPLAPTPAACILLRVSGQQLQPWCAR